MASKDNFFTFGFLSLFASISFSTGNDEVME